MVYLDASLMSKPEANINVKKWIEALRSGTFKQGQNALKTGDSYCCLGVGCVIIGGQTSLNYIYLDEVDADRLGLDSDRGQNLLSILNDDGVTFEEIADLLEADLKEAEHG